MEYVSHILTNERDATMCGLEPPRPIPDGRHVVRLCEACRIATFNAKSAARS